MLFLPVSILCFVIVAFMFIHIVKTSKTENKSNFKKINEIIYTLLTLAFGIYYPFLILKLGGKNKGVILSSAVDEFTLLGNLFIVGVMIIIALWGISAKIRTIRNPVLLEEQNNYEFFCSKLIEEYPNRSKVNRRVTHILPGAVVGICIAIFYFFLKDLLGNVWSNYALFFIVIIGIDFAFMFLVEDLIRLFDFSYMPPTAIKMFPKSVNSSTALDKITPLLLPPSLNIRKG